MAILNDPDSEAFFRQGDEGTYSGGPGDSIPTGVVNVFDDLDADTAPRLSREQLERRDRYTRWVTGFVGVLGATAVIAFFVRAVSGRDHDTAFKAAVEVRRPAADSNGLAVPAIAPVENKAVAQNDAPVVPRMNEPEPAPVTAVDHAASPDSEESRTPAVAHEGSHSVVAREPEPPARRSARSGEKTRTPEARAQRATRSLEAQRAPEPPKATSAPSFGHASPPTANFPD